MLVLHSLHYRAVIRLMLNILSAGMHGKLCRSQCLEFLETSKASWKNKALCISSLNGFQPPFCIQQVSDLLLAFFLKSTHHRPTKLNRKRDHFLHITVQACNFSIKSSILPRTYFATNCQSREQGVPEMLWGKRKLGQLLSLVRIEQPGKHMQDQTIHDNKTIIIHIKYIICFL